MSMSTTGDNTLFTRTATVPTIPSYSGFGRYVRDISVQRRLSLVAACGRSALLLIKDQSLFRRTGLFALMKELRVKTTLVIICLVLALPHSAKHTNTLPQQTTQNFYICTQESTVHKPPPFLNRKPYGVGRSLFDV